MYAKFYDANSTITDFAQKHRNSVGSDREFFRSIDYASLKDTNGNIVFDKQELYVLNELGGGEWLCDIHFAPNAGDVIEKIQRIIEKAKEHKYIKQNSIENKQVKKLIEGVSQ